MKSPALKQIAIYIVGASLSLVTTLSGASSCKCPKPPGGGVECTENQIAKCDPRGGECNCSCVSVIREKTTEEYKAIIVSSVLGDEVSPTELQDTFQGLKFREDKHKTDDKDEFTISLDFSKVQPPKGTRDWSFGGQREEDLKGASRVKVGLPGWLGDLLVAKGGVSIGPGASLQNCPNGDCASGDNSSAVGAVTQGAGSAFSVNQQGGITAGQVNIAAKPLLMSATQGSNIAQRLRGFRGQSVAVNVDKPTPETIKFANTLITSLTSAGINATESDGMFIGGCLAYPGVSFMAGVNRQDLVRSIWSALVTERIVEPADSIPGCSRSGEPNELEISIRPN